MIDKEVLDMVNDLNRITMILKDHIKRSMIVEEEEDSQPLLTCDRCKKKAFDLTLIRSEYFAFHYCYDCYQDWVRCSGD